MPGYPELPDSLRPQLATIQPNKCDELQYNPCQVQLRSGATIDRVYIVAEASYISLWGVYPEQDRGKFWIGIEDGVLAVESPSRLPARFADHGLSNFHPCLCRWNETSVRDGQRRRFEYPEDKKPSVVIAVLPHVGRDQNPRSLPKYRWCLHSAGEIPSHMRQTPIERLTLLAHFRFRRVWRRLRARPPSQSKSGE